MIEYFIEFYSYWKYIFYTVYRIYIQYIHFYIMLNALILTLNMTKYCSPIKFHVKSLSKSLWGIKIASIQNIFWKDRLQKSELNIMISFKICLQYNMHVTIVLIFKRKLKYLWYIFLNRKRLKPYMSKPLHNLYLQVKTFKRFKYTLASRSTCMVWIKLWVVIYRWTSYNWSSFYIMIKF